MTTSSFSPTAPTISTTSSSIQGELSALMRVHRPVVPKSLAFAIAMKPARAACLASAGIASSRLPSTTSTSAISSGTLARSFSMCGGTKWIMRSSFTGSSRSGAGAPIASGLKKLRGSFIRPNPRPKQESSWLPYEERPGLAKPLLQATARALTSTRAASAYSTSSIGHRCSPAWLSLGANRGKCRRSRMQPSRDFRSALLQWNIGLPDHFAPELRLLDEELGCLPAAFGDRLHLNSARLFAHVRSGEDLDHIAIDLVGQGRGRLRRRHHRVPGDGPVARQTRLGNGGNLRQFPHALRRADRHDLDLA